MLLHNTSRYNVDVHLKGSAQAMHMYMSLAKNKLDANSLLSHPSSLSFSLSLFLSLHLSLSLSI